MHAEQLFPTYLSQPGVLPPAPHAGGRIPKDPWGLFEQLFSHPPSPVSGQPPSIVSRPRFIPFFHSSILGLFLDFKNSKTIQFKCPNHPLLPPFPYKSALWDTNKAPLNRYHHDLFQNSYPPGFQPSNVQMFQGMLFQRSNAHPSEHNQKSQIANRKLAHLFLEKPF